MTTPGTTAQCGCTLRSPAAKIPTYEDLSLLHYAVWGEEGWAFQVFSPAVEHINIHGRALHLWGAADGRRMHPNFGFAASQGRSEYSR